MVKHEIAEQAGFRLLNANAPMHGVGVDTTGRRYMGRILFTFPSRISGAEANHTIWVDATIASGNFAPGIADRIDGVIGRDVLRHFEMQYNGPTGTVSLKFIRTKPTWVVDSLVHMPAN